MFLETPRFPTGIAHQSQGGPVFSTTIVPLRSGKTSRNQNWSAPLHVYNILPGIKTLADLEAVKDYFYAVAGRAGGFRFKDFADYKSCSLYATPASDDQILGTGDGTTAEFQLIKTYTKGALSMVRDIKKPVSGTALFEVGGVLATSGYTLATDTGLLTFATGSIPATGQVVKGGWEHDVPVEFGTDVFNVTAETTSYATDQLIFNIDSLPLRELRL